MIESIYDHPQSISEAQFDALISYIGKKLAAESVVSSAMAVNGLEADFPFLRHDQDLAIGFQSQRGGAPLHSAAKEILSSALSQEEAMNQRTVTLTRGVYFR
jgi:hypothetical protein